MRDYLRHKSLRQTSRCLATTNNATWSRYTPSTIGPVQNAEFWANKRLCFKLRNLEMVCFPTDSWDAIYNFAATLCELSNSSPFHTVFAYFSAFESEFLCCRQNFILCSKCPSHSMNRVWIDLPCKSILGIFTPQTLTVGLLKVTCKMFIYKDTQQLPLWGYTQIIPKSILKFLTSQWCCGWGTFRLYCLKGSDWDSAQKGFLQSSFIAQTMILWTSSVYHGLGADFRTSTQTYWIRTCIGTRFPRRFLCTLKTED